MIIAQKKCIHTKTAAPFLNLNLKCKAKKTSVHMNGIAAGY